MQPDIAQWPRALFRIRPSARFGGIGLFALRNIARNTIIAAWEDLNEDLFFPWHDFATLDVETQGMVADYCAQSAQGFYAPRDINLISLPWHMNHACNGNVGFNADGDFVAIADVAMDEELTFDYGLMITNPDYRLVCKCGAGNCRGVVTGNDWKDAEFRSRNLAIMTPEVREMIDSECQ